MADTLDKVETHRLIASDKVDGTAVYDRSGERLGTIRNFMVDKRSGQAQYAVLQFGGLFGIGSDYYPIPWQKLTFDPSQGGYVVDLTKAQVEGAPSYGHDAPSLRHALPVHLTCGQRLRSEQAAQPFAVSDGRTGMPAKSKAQQKAAGAALSAKRGDTKKGELQGASRDMYESMSEKQLEELASTKHRGKPEHVHH